MGLQEDQAAARGWKQAFPDLSIVPEKLVAEGDLVSVYWTARGTNAGEGNGLPATGKHLELSAVTIWRVVDGRITDEWSAFDQLWRGSSQIHSIQRRRGQGFNCASDSLYCSWDRHNFRTASS